jgi:glycine cleavage system H lipoate-binding protein
MLPWVYEFSWHIGNVVFLGIFYFVVIVLLASLISAVKRTVKSLDKRAEFAAISWHIDFDELPVSAKVCRHVIAGELQDRICPNGFDCRVCDLHAKIVLQNAIDRREPSARTISESVFGLSVPNDRLYHRGHTWVKREHNGTLKVGLDDFATKILGKPDATIFPKVGAELKVNSAGWFLIKNGMKIRVLSPVDGKVIEINQAGNRSPLSSNDYYLRVKPVDGIDLRHLLRGREARLWIMREVERLEKALSSEKVGVSLADGGELVNDLPKIYPEINWDNVFWEIFLET